MSKRAFTLIELLVVVAIVGILSGFVIVQMNGAINSANDAKKKANLSSIKKALIVYGVEHGNSYPIESGCTIGECSTFDSALSSLLPQNLNGTYTYQSDGTSFSVSSVLSSGYAYTYNSVTNSFATAEPTAGSCGTASKTYTYTETTYGSDTFCTLGTSTPSSPSFPELGSSTTWTCPGQNGGATTSCSASRNGTPVDGSCGTKNGKYASIEPSGTQACTTGTITGMIGSYSWTCAGSNGGDSPSCATVAAAYTVTSFTTVGTSSWTVPTGVTSVEYLVVAGGGGGGGAAWGVGGGGGGGGLRTGSLSVSSSVSVTVGDGGAAGTSSNDYKGGNGGVSVFGSITSVGGGGGGSYYNTTDADSHHQGKAGGSGGGGGGSYVGDGTGGYGTSGQGYAGGSGGSDQSTNSVGGGGGGAGGIGESQTNLHGGDGGIGIDSSITGSAVYYAGGGGGGSQQASRRGGYGGSSVGGDGGCGTTAAVVGITNRGGGGGGGGNGTVGAAGGSGIVVVRYINNY